ncbi:uncharacterized protein SRS1_15638 [Sporisorium reilianum f. sp. reilianum]|uniref:Uncharacterized protein n=1 Tax=Sporisorium reilianum f. sp. reilianum TaxID=72559 RepID=A0A2N8UKB1_9BASI|nr:uncharacterized protein SRS1_15638 [Sporisorium reilianum f. sp. reilianum]
MSSFYDRSMSVSSSSRKSFDALDRSRSPSRAADASMDRPGSSRAFHHDASTLSLGANRNGGAPMHAMMVPGVVVPSIDRPNPDSPFSQWEAYIVQQAQEWSDKRANSAASPASPPPTNSSPRIVWADQIRKPAAPQTQPLVYTKARDRFAAPSTPQGPPPPMARGLLRKASMDLFRSGAAENGRTTPSPPASATPSISSPIMATSMLTTAPPSSVAPSAAPSYSRVSYDTPYTRALPEPLQVPQNIDSQASSVRSLSPLPLSLPGDDFSASLLINFEKRSSTSSASSGRAPGPSELLAAPLASLLNSEASSPPSIADTLSIRSRRFSWASSVDLDPAIICTPPLSNESWQDQSQSSGRPAFLADFELDHDTDESETECSVYPDDHEEILPMPSVGNGSPVTPREHQFPPQPVFQRLEADVISLADCGDGLSASQRFTPDGRPLPQLDISSLPREKEEMIRKARAQLISPSSFRKAFKIKKKHSVSGSASSGSRSNDSSPSLPNSSSEEVGKITESTPQTPTATSPRARMPSIVAEDMTQWAAGIPAEAPPTSPLERSTSLLSEAPSMQPSPSVASSIPTMTSTETASSAPLSPTFSTGTVSIASETSVDGFSSLNSFGHRKHRVATPGLTKVPSSAAGPGASATLDPHLARVTTRARSSGSVSSNTPSIALSNTSSKARRTSRRSGRSRITDSMPSFANMASSLAVPVNDQRRFSNRSLSSDGSIDSHSNASNGSSYAKVGGSSDDGMPPLSTSSASSTGVFKSVLRKRAPSEASLLSPKKEVSFDLSASRGFGTVEEAGDEEDEELLEHEQRQRSHLTLPPMKLQAKQAATDGDAATADSETVTLGRDDLDILHFLSSFGKDIQSVESLEVLDSVHAGAHELPKRQDWDSLPAFLVAYATTVLSAYTDDSATLVYSDERAPARAGAAEGTSSLALGANSVYTSSLRSILRIASWEQPAVSAGVCAAYTYSWKKGRLAAMLLAGLALLVATQGSAKDSAADAEELEKAYSKLAPVLLGSATTHERMRNLLLHRSPRASLRLAGLLVALAVGATQVDSRLVLCLPGLLLGLALFVWLPIVLHQPEWAPAGLKTVSPVDVLLYDVPTDAQHAMITMRRRAAGGEQLVHRVDSARAAALHKLVLSPTSFDHRISPQELQHASDVVEGAHFAVLDNEAGHLVVLASRVIFRTLAGKSQAPVGLIDELAGAASAGRITLDARLEKVVRMDKTADGLRMRLKNGQVFVLDQVQDRDVAFNRVVALAPQRWH